MSEGFFAFQPPAEVVQRMREQAAHAQMHRMEDEHAIRDLFSSLEKEELETFLMVLRRSSNKQINAYYQGRIEALLETLHDCCPCGTDHNAPPTVEDVQTTLDPEEAFPHGPHATFEMDPEEVAEMNEETAASGMTDDEEILLMEQYTLEPDPMFGAPWDELKMDRSIPPSKFRCTVCGMGYSSLEDRMRRPAGIDGCTGCQRKSAQG
jgi:hypothetical protein